MLLSTKQKFMDFQQARQFVHNLGIKSARDWKNYVKSAKKPSYIPATPNFVYKDEWQVINSQ